MINILFFIPLFAIIMIVLLYRLNGSKEILRFDLVQFLYAFVIAPVMFVWGKSFFYLLLRTELDVKLSQSDLFFFDTLFSVFSMYVFAFVVIHSLTKSFKIKALRDPLHDIFHHSEYFHLWLSHIVTFFGGMTLLSFFAIANVFFPLEVNISRFLFHLLTTSGVLGGIFIFIAIWLSDPKQIGANFMRLMKLLFAFFFMIHVIVFFVFDPSYGAEYTLFWVSLIVFATLVTCSLFVYRSTRAKNIVEQVSDKLKHNLWGINIELFK